MSESLEILSHDYARINVYNFLNHVDVVILPAGTAALRALPSHTTSITITARLEFSYAKVAADVSPNGTLMTHTVRAENVYQRFSEGGRYGYRNLAHDGKGDAVVFTVTTREQISSTNNVSGTEIFSMNISYQYYRDRIDRDGAGTIVLRVHCPIRRGFLIGVPSTVGTVISAATYRTYV